MAGGARLGGGRGRRFGSPGRVAPQHPLARKLGKPQHPAAMLRGDSAAESTRLEAQAMLAEAQSAR